MATIPHKAHGAHRLLSLSDGCQLPDGHGTQLCSDGGRIGPVGRNLPLCSCSQTSEAQKILSDCFTKCDGQLRRATERRSILHRTSTARFTPDRGKPSRSTAALWQDPFKIEADRPGPTRLYGADSSGCKQFLTHSYPHLTDNPRNGETVRHAIPSRMEGKSFLEHGSMRRQDDAKEGSSPRNSEPAVYKRV